MQTRENSVGPGPNPDIDLLHSNIARLEKLERRLMRGERHANRKKSGANEHGEHEHEATFGRENRRKGKKEKKNWRFAYDLYCKELISGNLPHSSSHRSNPSQEMSHRIRSREKSTNLHPPPHQNLLSQTTYVRHTATSNSVARREAYTKGTQERNPGRESRQPSPSRASKASRIVQNNRSMQSSCRR